MCVPGNECIAFFFKCLIPYLTGKLLKNKQKEKCLSGAQAFGVTDFRDFFEALTHFT